MKRRGFLGLFGGTVAAAFVPHVIATSIKLTDRQTWPAVVAPKPPKGAKVWMFGSVYSQLRIQITPKKAVQFFDGRYWTDDRATADAVRAALARGEDDIARRAKDGFRTHPLIPYGWEIQTREDLERLQAATAARRS